MGKRQDSEVENKYQAPKHEKKFKVTSNQRNEN